MIGSGRVSKLWTAIPALSLLLASGPSRTEDSPGDQVMKKMDEALTRAKDQSFEYDFVIEEPGKAPRTMVFAATIKGTKWRRVEFLAPGDVKGMKYLSLSTTQMYVYLPAFRKVRRVASHVNDQGFMGSAYDTEEMSTVTYGDLFSGKLVSENDKEFAVTGTLRPGQEYRYARIEFKIDKQMYQPTELRYYNEKGDLLKTEIRSDFECGDNLCNPKLMVMTNHTRNNMVSKMIRKSWKHNSGIPESFFTVRDLQRGN